MNTMKGRQSFFLKEKPVMALITLRRNRQEMYGSIVSKKIDTTYAHTIKILAELEDQGLITSQKKGRKNVLELTEEGETCADKLIELMESLEVSESPSPIAEETPEKSF